MRLAFLVLTLDDIGGTARAVVNLANALVDDHDVRILSLRRTAERPHADLDTRVRVQHLIDARDEARPTVPGMPSLDVAEAARLDATRSLLVPREWEWQFSGLTDLALRRALPEVTADVLVTVVPGLLALAAQLMPASVGLVHQEHRTSFDRAGGREALLAFAPRADVVTMLGEPAVAWLQEELGDTCPETLVMPNLIPRGYRPRSRLAGDDSGGMVMAAGRFNQEKQFGHLVRAFGQVAEDLPGWRVRIFGSGPMRRQLRSIARHHGLHDRVELPGVTRDMAAEWALADIAVCCSVREGLPLVAQEAMAAGVPMVAYDCPLALRDIVLHDVNGLLVAPGSEAGLARAILQLASDRELRSRMGAAALASCDRYDARLVTEQWTDIFERVVQRRRAGAVAGGPIARASAAAASPAAAERADPVPAAIRPEDARSRVLGVAAELAAGTGDDWFVIPASFPDHPTVVLPMTSRRAFLERLAAADLPSWLSAVDPPDGRWYERRGTPGEIVAAVARGMTPRLVLEPWPETSDGRSLLAEGCRVDVEFWTEDIAGNLRPPRHNRYVNLVRRGWVDARCEVAGHEVPTLELMTRPAVEDVQLTVDVVYTWVDADDDAWDRARQERLASLTGSVDGRTTGRTRFTSRDELRYSMRTIDLFAPWVRTVHLVTAGQVPSWLRQHPRVRVVDHREILPAEALPTFNSHAIETALHRIDGLAEHFLYLNDDMFLGRPVAPRDFFDAGGRSAVFPAPHPVSVAAADDRPYLLAARNNRALLERACGRTVLRQLAHAPYAHRVSVLEEIEERFAPEVAATARSPFRSADDVSLLSSLAQHYGLATGTAYVGSIESAYVDLGAPGLGGTLTALVRERAAQSFCLADSDRHADGTEAGAAVDQVLRPFMEAYAPLAAPWERFSSSAAS